MATIKGILEGSSVFFYAITNGTEARPSTTAKVMWVGATTRPTNMLSGDIWLKESTAGASPPEFITIALNTITQGVAFSQGLVVDGTTPLSFSITSGILPAGLTLHSSTGVISGTPTASGTYTFTVTATNALGSAAQAFTGTVTASAVAPNITTTSLNTLTQGTPFSQTLNATGTSPMTWSVSGGTLPAGLTLNSSTGIISGTPTGTGSYSFTLTLTNSVSSDTQGYTGEVGSTGTAPSILTTTLNALQAGVSFTQSLSRTGSTPMTWGVSTGTIPTGLTINSSTGVISGTPTTAGAYSFTVQSSNAFGSDTQLYSGTVAAATSDAVYSIFGATTWPLTSYSDGVSGAWTVQQYYQYSGSSALPSSSRIIGARQYVPPGSAHIGKSWKAAVYLNNSGTYYSSTNRPNTVSLLNGSGTAKDGLPLVEGWNEILFDAEHIPPSGFGNSWLIGTLIDNGTSYFHDATLTNSSITNPQGKNFLLAEMGPVTVARSWYQSTDTSARWYGVDVLIRVPS